MESDEFLLWDPSFSVGNELIDLHHQKLFELIAMFNGKIAYAQEREKMLAIFEDLKQYTLMHFKAEEKFMASLNFSDLEVHIKSHQDLVRRIDEFQSKMDQMQEVHLREVSKFLKEWIVIHVLHEDMQFVSKG